MKRIVMAIMVAFISTAASADFFDDVGDALDPSHTFGNNEYGHFCNDFKIQTHATDCKDFSHHDQHPDAHSAAKQPGVYLPDITNAPLIKYYKGDYVVWDTDDGKYHKPSDLKIRESDDFKYYKEYGANAVNNFVRVQKWGLNENGYSNNDKQIWAIAFTAKDSDWAIHKKFKERLNDTQLNTFSHLNEVQKIQYISYNSNLNVGTEWLPSSPIGGLN